MKKSFKLIFAILLLLGHFQLPAQEKGFSFIVKAGFNVSNTNLDIDDYSGFKQREPHVGFNINLIGDYAFSKSFSIQSGLIYTTKGVKLKGFEAWLPSGEEYWDKKYNLCYLQLPLLAVYKYNVNDDFNVFINAGPYFAYGVGGKATTRTRYYNLGDKPDEKEKEDSFGDNGLKRFDWGLIAEIGTELNRISVTFNYEIGLTDPAHNRNILYSDAEFKNRNATVSFGYRF